MAIAAGACALALSGCVPAPGPSTGTDGYVQGTRTAMQDVLGDTGVQLETGPQCGTSAAGAVLVCSGRTTDGRQAEARARGGDEDDLQAAELVVTLDGRTVYEGTVQAVLAKAD